MSWHRVLRAQQLAAEDAPVLVEVQGKSIGLYRSGAAVRAVLNYCPHKGAPICRGRVESFAPVTPDRANRCCSIAPARYCAARGTTGSSFSIPAVRCSR